jgi:6-phosphogluconolactonase
LWKGLVLVPCLELDEVRIYDPARGFAQVDALTFPAGTGPRHGVLDRAGERLFLVSERSNQLFLFGAEGRRFIPAAAYPVAEHGASAAIRLSRDERFVYLSTRESDVLTVFQTEGLTARRVQQVPCGGRHPRDFDLTADGRWLLCLNRDSGELVSFPADPGTGLLGPRCASLRAPRGSGILLNAN